jgi:hypothetical protein
LELESEKEMEDSKVKFPHGAKKKRNITINEPKP